MAKENPVRQFDQNLGADSERRQSFLKDLMQATNRDITDRAAWTDKRAHYQRRRYGREWRDPVFPWPGSSSIVMPLIDKSIDQLKAQFTNLALAAKPPVTVVAVDAASQQKAPNLEVWFEWLLKYASPYYQDELILAVDDLLETGRGILKTTWWYETRKIPETVQRSRLPARLQRLLVNARTPREADLITAQLRARGVNGVGLTKQEFDRLKPQFQIALQLEYDLDPEEPGDKKALEDLTNWYRDGGTEPFTFNKRDVVINAPAITAVSPLDFIVPESTGDLNTAERMTHVTFVNEQQIRQRVSDGGWNKSVAKKVLEKGRGEASGLLTRRQYDDDEAHREGMFRDFTNVWEIWETCTYMSGGLGQPDKKVVVVWSPKVPDQPLKFYEYPRDRWPYHTATFERNKRRWHSARGVPEKLDDLESEITWQHRNKLNRMAIANSLTLVSSDPTFNAANLTWIPGSVIHARPGTLEPLQIPNIQVSEEREEQILRTWAEEYIGGTDFGLTNPLSNLQEPRTATEIRGIQQSARTALSLRGSMFQKMMGEVYNEFFELWHQYGPQDAYVRVTGGDDPLKITKEEMQGNFVFQPTGTIGEQDPALEAQKAQNRLFVLMQIAQNGLAEPQYELNLGEAVADYLEKDDIRLSKRIMRRRSPQEVQAIVQEQQRKAQAAENTLINEPQSLEELETGVKELQKQAPNKGAQRIRA
jgi:hypothetical protein